MANVHLQIKINPNAVQAISKMLTTAAVKTMEDLKDDLITSQTMPFDVGTMQNADTFCTVRKEGDSIRGALVTGSPYARYQYYGISRKGNALNYQTVNNPNAGAHWLNPYLDGAFLKEAFKRNIKEAGADVLT